MNPERKISGSIVVRHDAALTKVRTVLKPFLVCCMTTIEATGNLTEHGNTLHLEILVTGRNADRYVEALLDTVSGLIALDLCEPLNIRIDRPGTVSLPEYIPVGMYTPLEDDQ